MYSIRAYISGILGFYHGQIGRFNIDIGAVRASHYGGYLATLVSPPLGLNFPSCRTSA